MTTFRDIANNLRYVDDFPIEGIRFFDFESILENSNYWETVIMDLYERYKDKQIDYVVGLDARGFLIAGALGMLLKCGIKQARKPGKLPGKTIGQEYMREYGPAELHMEETELLVGANVLIVDDLLATGGTLGAAVELVENLGGIVVECACVIELPELGGRGHVSSTPIYTKILIRDNQAVLHEDCKLCVDAAIIDVDTKELVLVDRLNDPKGIAMMGGKIEIDGGESANTTISREIQEELGLDTIVTTRFTGIVLAGADRDPRGDQVSYVFEVKVRGSKNAVGEAGKTKPVLIKNLNALEEVSNYAFSDHGSFLANFGPKRLKKKTHFGVDEMEM